MRNAASTERAKPKLTVLIVPISLNQHKAEELLLGCIRKGTESSECRPNLGP